MSCKKGKILHVRIWQIRYMLNEGHNAFSSVSLTSIWHSCTPGVGSCSVPAKGGPRHRAVLHAALTGSHAELHCQHDQPQWHHYSDTETTRHHQQKTGTFYSPQCQQLLPLNWPKIFWLPLLRLLHQLLQHPLANTMFVLMNQPALPLKQLSWASLWPLLPSSWGMKPLISSWWPLWGTSHCSPWSNRVGSSNPRRRLK